MELGRNDHFLERNAVKEQLFANLRSSWRQPNVRHSHTVSEGGVELTSTSRLQFSEARGPIL